MRKMKDEIMDSKNRLHWHSNIKCAINQRKHQSFFLQTWILDYYHNDTIASADKSTIPYYSTPYRRLYEFHMNHLLRFTLEM